MAPPLTPMGRPRPGPRPRPVCHSPQDLGHRRRLPVPGRRPLRCEAPEPVEAHDMVDTRRFGATFAMLGEDGGGRVSAGEVKEIMAPLGVTYTDASAATAISMMGAAGDGLVTLEELAAYLRGEHGPR